MGIKTDLNIAPYFDDYDIEKKYYRVLFKPGFAVQARELTQMQTNLQNQIEQFGENIYKEGSIIKGCTFTELRNLQYVKVVDQINTIPTFTRGDSPINFIERTEIIDGSSYEYYYEIEDETGLKAIIVQAENGFQSRAPDLNTFFVSYLNTSTVGGFEKKVFEPNDVLSIREWYILREPTEVVDVFSETVVDNGVVATTSVASFSTPIGQSFGLNASEGIIFQRGHFLFVDDQTIVVKKYISAEPVEFAIEPNNISVGYVVDESIVNSQQDTSLLDNATGSPNENAPGADRLLLVPRLVALDTTTAEANSEFFILRRYENGVAVETRDVSEFNSIGKELARRTYETSGDYTKKPFTFQVLKKDETDDFYIEMSEGVAYSKGFRVANNAKRLFRIPPIETTTTITGQPINFEYGGYVKIVSETGRVPIGTMQTVDLYAANGTTIIGSAFVSNYVPGRMYIFGVRMDTGKNFNEVKYVQDGANGLIEIIPKMIGVSKSRLVFDTGRSFVKSISDMALSLRKVKTDATLDASGVVVIEPSPNEVFDTINSFRDLLVVRNATNEVATITDKIITVTGNLQITTDLTGVAGAAVTVYYNINTTNLEPRVKQLLNVYVKNTYTTASSKYTLGLPDVVSIESVTGASGSDFTKSFRLVRNQRDNFYDHSYIEKIQGTATPANNEVLTINVRVFKVDGSSNINIFNINSYANIDISDIPYFIGEDGNTYDLKSCLDFRPYRTASANYSTTAGGATLFSTVNGAPSLPSYSTEIFSNSFTYTIPSLTTSGSVSVEFYESRTDLLVGTSLGRFKYIVGEEGGTTNRLDVKENSIIAEIRIPGYPLLTSEDAFRLNRRSETISIVKKTVNTYTMKDIDDLSKRVDKLTYYVVLSALEASAKNLSIQDENGLDRFKNGIIVDAFSDLSISDVNDPKFSVSIDSSEKAIYPSVKQFTMNMNLKSGSTSNTALYGSNLTLSANSNSIRFMRQQYASSFRTCTSNFWKYNGTGKLEPEYDVGYDTVTTPQNLTIDFARPFVDFVEALNEIVPLTTSADSVVSSTTSIDTVTTASTITETTTISTEIENLQRTLTANIGASENIFVGDFVSNVEFKPYMRPREVAISMFGLRPNTRHYFFFDETPVDEFIAPGIALSSLTSPDTNFGPSVRRNGAFGQEVKTNSAGELFAVFNIPGNTFIVGERDLVIADVDDYDSISSSSASAGKLKYNAYNFGIDKIGLTQSTRQPSFDIVETTTTRTVVDRTVESRESGGKDPLAQTFFIKQAMTQEAEALYLSYINLFFKRKSLINGVTVMIREVENGYPSKEILPFSIKHIKSSEVNVSDDSSLATPIVFDAPVRLEAEKEYAIVIMPDAADPDYLVFTQRVGGTDLITGKSINSDWGDGVLFTSTNNRAWKSYQDEDLKFELFRYNFNVNSGTAELENEDHEFLKIGALTGQFAQNEFACAFKEGSTTYQVTLSTSNNVVTGSNLSNYQPGDYIYVDNGSGQKDILRVVNIISGGTSVSVDKIPLFAGSYQSRPVVAGRVVYFNSRRPDFLVLEGSSARLGRIFAASDSIFGLSSGATASIVSVDNVELSYMQAMVNRVTDANTNVKIALKAIDPTNEAGLPYTKPFAFGETKRFNERGCKIYSKSNDIAKEKNMKLVLTLQKDNIQTTTPFVDVETAQVFAYIYNVTSSASTTTSYISKKVELQDGFDSEDFKIYITAYRPPGAGVKAYIRVKNESDPVSLKDNPWIELERIEGERLFSSNSNLKDYKEYVYVLPESYKNELGQLTYTNSTGTYETYKTFAVRIDLLSNNVASVPKIIDYRGIAFE